MTQYGLLIVKTIYLGGKKMEWIEIQKEFPKDCQLVKVKGKFPFQVNCEFRKTPLGYFFIKIPSDLEFYRVEIYGVTHWKVLDGMD
jgi:hypothetical protein